MRKVCKWEVCEKYRQGSQKSYQAKRESRGDEEVKPEEALKELSYDDTAYGGKCTHEVRMEAIKALEKQIPKKVLYEDVGFDCYHDVNLYACICPSCGLHIIDFSDDDVNSKCNSDNPEDMFHSSMVYHAYIGMNNYCNRCGQKLDWREEE